MHKMVGVAINVSCRASLIVCFLFSVVHISSVDGAISCYTCSSRNGSDVNCEDPFHPAHSEYKVACMVPKEGHVGKFPANFCVKVVGTVYGTKEKLVIRTCTLENMENQCGAFRYEHEHLTGCILTCQSDGCNSAQGLYHSSQAIQSVVYSTLLMLAVYWVAV